ncbi:MAG: class I SAM-dependent methyltransferase [Deltaproteobacteria bacterium]|nr:class I SAM-dependent methyltransferase [Deltaproteobacteria bacterium]
MRPATDSKTSPSGVARFTALFLLSASTLLFEVLLTKLFANKLEHHYTFAIIGLALLGYGGSGVLVQLKRETFLRGGMADGMALWRYTLAWAFSILGVVPLFLLLPFDPAVPGAAGALALPLYFLLFAAPFFVAGVPVAAMLMSSDLHPSRVYFWDLLGAALGALAGPWLLPRTGAYGAVVLSAAMAVGAAIVIRASIRTGALRACLLAVVAFLAAGFVSLLVPNRMRSALGFDMVSFKALVVKSDFFALGPPTQIYWNPIARLDVSRTGISDSVSFRYGLPLSLRLLPIEGRLILVDGGANSRQFVLDRHPRDTQFLSTTLWAAPYVLHPRTGKVLVIGAGGGIDILVGKHFGATEIDALELNPDMARLLAGRPEDRERDLYTRWLQSDDRTQVTIHNVEARHFVYRQRDHAHYDIVLASGVDTLTAIQSSGNALSENFLYTADAVKDYLAVLNPGGVLALTHWHLEPPKHALKMFATYLQVLEQSGVDNPSRHVCVVSDAMSEKFGWESTLLKKGSEFTLEEVKALREYAARVGFQIVWDPFLANDAPVRRDGDLAFRRLGMAKGPARSQVIADLPYDITPSTDDRPYFYWVGDKSEGKLSFYDGNWVYADVLYPQSSMRWMLRLAVLLSLGLALVPAFIMKRRGMSLRELAAPIPFFAASGFAFVMAENAVFLMITLFVGGPLYSLSVVLPSILGGYAFGSLLSGRLGPGKRRWLAVLAALCVAAFGAFALIAFQALPQLIALSQPARMAIAVLLVVPFAAVLGLFVPWYMAGLKTSEADPTLAWMWSLSAVGNVLGAMVFVPLCHAFGTRMVFALAAGLYLLALGWAAWTTRAQAS